MAGLLLVSRYYYCCSCCCVFVALLFFGFFFNGLQCRALGKAAPFAFSFERFGKNGSLDLGVAFYGDAEICNGSVAQLTRPVSLSAGRIVYRQPMRFFGTQPGFSAYFSFSLSSGDGNGLAFFLLPSRAHLGSADRRSPVGISPGVVAVEFLTADRRFGNLSGNLVGINVGREMLVNSCNFSSAGSVLNTGKKLHSWIDYDGASKRIEVRLSKSRDLRPINASISYTVDLSSILWREAMLVGLSSSNGNSTQTCNIYSWSFEVKHGATYLMHSEPLDPNSFLVQSHKNHENPATHVSRTYPWGVFMAMLFAAACGALVTFFVMFVCFSLVARRPVAPVEYPVHPVDAVYEKIVLVGSKGVDCGKK